VKSELIEKNYGMAFQENQLKKVLEIGRINSFIKSGISWMAPGYYLVQNVSKKPLKGNNNDY
tara:strand:- start:7538 stop:7723 length:186 start_codon:yes stop_codon:yes gene_type:complete